MNRPFAGWLLALVLIPGLSAPAAAFTAEFRTASRWMNSILFPPDAISDATSTPDTGSEELISALENRLIIEGQLVDPVDYSVHILTTAQYATIAGPALSGVDPGGRSGGFFRHPDLEWEWDEADTGAEHLTGVTVPDRLLLEWRSESAAIGLGRQAIGLSNCFYLTINDFFEPLAAEAFYREYKPGVDSVVARYYPGSLSEMDLIGVAGYNDSGDADWDESAVLARSVFTASGFQWTLMGGKLPYRLTAGGGFQGEIGRFGVRAEANVNFPQTGYDAAFGTVDSGTYAQVAGGFDIRFDNSLHVFVEYLYRGNGYGQYTDYMASVARAGAVRETWAARNYATLAATYEWHPLLTTQVMGLINVDDGSALMSLIATYSLSDEADLVFGGYLPAGDEPRNVHGVPIPRSQYGASDGIAYLELRFYL